MDKVEYLKKNGPLPQFSQKIFFDKKTGKLTLKDQLKVKAKQKLPPK